MRIKRRKKEGGQSTLQHVDLAGITESLGKLEAENKELKVKLSAREKELEDGRKEKVSKFHASLKDAVESRVKDQKITPDFAKQFLAIADPVFEKVTSVEEAEAWEQKFDAALKALPESVGVPKDRLVKGDEDEEGGNGTGLKQDLSAFVDRTLGYQKSAR